MSAGIQWLMNLPRWWNISRYSGASGSSSGTVTQHDHGNITQPLEGGGVISASDSSVSVSEHNHSTDVTELEQNTEITRHEHGADVTESNAIVTVED